MISTMTLAEKEAIEYGIDVNLIECNLNLTYKERLRQHQEALDLVLALKKAGQQMRNEQSLQNSQDLVGSEG